MFFQTGKDTLMGIYKNANLDNRTSTRFVDAMLFRNRVRCFSTLYRFKVRTVHDAAMGKTIRLKSCLSLSFHQDNDSRVKSLQALSRAFRDLERMQPGGRRDVQFMMNAQKQKVDREVMHPCDILLVHKHEELDAKITSEIFDVFARTEEGVQP